MISFSFLFPSFHCVFGNVFADHDREYVNLYLTAQDQFVLILMLMVSEGDSDVGVAAFARIVN